MEAIAYFLESWKLWVISYPHLLASESISFKVYLWDSSTRIGSNGSKWNFSPVMSIVAYCSSLLMRKFLMQPSTASK